MTLPGTDLSEKASAVELQSDLRQRQAELLDCLQKAIEEFHPKISLACSFGAEDMLLVDALSRIRPGARVFYLDTGLLFDETYQLIELAKKKFPLQFERVATELSVQAQEKLHGPALWSRLPDQCCQIRKVEPLKHMLSTLDAWITGIRREQAPSRAQAQIREWDSKFQLVKFNPLALWSIKDVWKYIHKYEVPYNPLHDRNYPSIGCIPCTAPVLPGQDPRSGRWAGFAKTECGLHK